MQGQQVPWKLGDIPFDFKALELGSLEGDLVVGSRGEDGIASKVDRCSNGSLRKFSIRSCTGRVS